MGRLNRMFSSSSFSDQQEASCCVTAAAGAAANKNHNTSSNGRSFYRPRRSKTAGLTQPTASAVQPSVASAAAATAAPAVPARVVQRATTCVLAGGVPTVVVEGARSNASGTMPLSLLPPLRQQQQQTSSSGNINTHMRGGSGSRVWSRIVRGITGGSGVYRRSRTMACGQPNGKSVDVDSHGSSFVNTDGVAVDLFNNTASNGCYYYYYYSTHNHNNSTGGSSPASSSGAAGSSNSASSTNSANSVPPCSSLAPFPPPNVSSSSVLSHPSHAIAGFKLLLPIPIKRTISEGPRGPQLSSTSVCGAQPALANANSLAGLTPASATEDYASTSMDVPTQGSGSEEVFSDAGDDAVTIWSDTSSCGFSDDCSHLTTGQSTAAPLGVPAQHHAAGAHLRPVASKPVGQTDVVRVAVR
eukprot:GHVS01008266.1.p1 GENE.GHVS01008266.1~~GHVS01008266.1.p1  ORF type:complete len:414 (+),score=85.47 GHVS01008266.1:456-1697(+)